MRNRLWGVILFAVVAALGAEAQYNSVNGSCTLGGQATVTQGMPSSGTRPLRGSTTFNGTGVMASYPGCTVTVFQTGTNTPALIYSSAIGGSRSNPFTADLNDGSWVFFAAQGCYDVLLSSGATQASTMPNSKTLPGLCAGAGSGGGGGGTTGSAVTINGVQAIPNAYNFTNTMLVPGGSSVVNFLLNGNTVGAYVTGTGGGGGGSLPTTPQYDLFASTGSGGAQTSGLLGGSGFLKGQVFLATGDVTSAAAPFAIAPNASVEYFPSGASFGGINLGATNGLAAYFSHSGRTGASPGYGNGGVMLGGGNSSGTNYQVYLDCESAPSLNCDFKVPITVNGTGVGGGGGGGFPTIPQWNLFASSGTGGAVDSGVLAQSGFLRGYVLEATGTGNASPFSLPNGSIEYFPTGGYGIGGVNGLALHFSHSGISNGTSPGWGNGGIALGGGNASGVNYQIYLDCESAPLGCDFKVPVTYNGGALGGGGGAGVSSINGVAGAFNFTGAGVSCATTTCTFSGGGGGGGLPTIPVNHVFASTGAGAAQDSNVQAAPNIGGTGLGVIKSGASIVGGMIGGTSPFTGSNGSQEWYGGGGVIGSVTVPNGAVLIMGNSASTVGATGNGGVVLGGNSAATTSSKEVYVDCEHTGCDFKAPITVNGGAVGGGGGGSGTVSSGAAGHFTWYAAAGTTVASNANLDDSVTTAATITSQEPVAAPGINVTGTGGIAMTGTGGTLPTPVASSGGIGIGPGNVPEFYSNGGAWTAIGGGGTTLPTIAATNLFASNGSGGAQDTGVQATGGFLQSGASIVKGTASGSPFTGANASQEFYNAGGTITPSTGSPITFTNGAALFMGRGASTAGATGDGGIALGGGSATPTSRIYLDCEVAGCDFKVPITVNGGGVGGGSGTVSPNNGTAGALAYYSAAGGSTTVQNAANAIVTATGIMSGASSMLSWGATLGGSTDTGLSRIVAGLVGFGNGQNNLGETSMYRSANSCAQATAIAFSSTGLASSFCQRFLAIRSLSWIIHCVIPWNFTGGTGTTPVTFGVTFNQGLTSAAIFTTILWGGASPQFSTATVGTASSPNTLITANLDAANQTTIYSTVLDGVITVQPTGTTSVNFTATVGSSNTAQINAGAYCRFE